MTGRPSPGSAAARRATRLAFLIAGMAGAAWAPLIPFVKSRNGLDDGRLGLLLLCFGLGSIVAMPAAAMLAGRLGCRPLIVGASAAVCAALPVLSTSGSIPLLVLTLTLFGAGVGTIDCIVNVQAVIVERASGRTMMSGFHGLFSLGGIVGAGGISLLLAAGLSPLAVSGAMACLLALACCLAMPGLLADRTEGGGFKASLPRGVVLVIGAMCFVVFLTEGAAIDWSAVLLTTVRGVEVSYAGLGYAAFALTMTAGRLSGDRLVRRFGGGRLVVGGSLLAAAGMFVIAAVPAWQLTLLGYAMVGAGCSNVVPVLYSAIGRQRRMPEHLAVPAVTTLGYAGILLGPVGLGFIAAAASLPTAIALVGLCLVVVAAAGLGLRLLDAGRTG